MSRVPNGRACGPFRRASDRNRRVQYRRQPPATQRERDRIRTARVRSRMLGHHPALATVSSLGAAIQLACAPGPSAESARQRRHAARVRPRCPTRRLRRGRHRGVRRRWCCPTESGPHTTQRTAAVNGGTCGELLQPRFGPVLVRATLGESPSDDVEEPEPGLALLENHLAR